MSSKLDLHQILQKTYDEETSSLKTTATVSLPASQEVVISHTDDSIKLGDGLNTVTATPVGGDVGLDVNVIGGVVSGNFTSSGLQSGLKTTKIIVGDTPTKIPATPLEDRNSISVRVWGATTVYFGDSTVTAEAGYPKRQFEEVTMDIKDSSAVELYAVCDAGMSCELRILEIA